MGSDGFVYCLWVLGSRGLAFRQGSGVTAVCLFVLQGSGMVSKVVLTILKLLFASGCLQIRSCLVEISFERGFSSRSCGGLWSIRVVERFWGVSVCFLWDLGGSGVLGGRAFSVLGVYSLGI